MLILRRRRFVVNRRLQVSILLTALSHVGLLVAVVSTALFAPLVHQLTGSGPVSPADADAALRILYLHETYWLPVLLAFIAIALHSIAASHRIAGPVYRFRRVCESMALGFVPRRVILRKRDHLREEMEVVNEMLATWRSVVADAQREASVLGEALAAARQGASGGEGPGDAEDAWRRAERCAERLRETLGRVSFEGEHRGGDRRPAHGDGPR